MTVKEQMDIIQLILKAITGIKSPQEFHDFLYKSILDNLSSKIQNDSYLFLNGLMCAVYVCVGQDTYTYSVVTHNKRINETQQDEFKNFLENKDNNFDCVSRTENLSFPKNYSTNNIHQLTSFIQAVVSSNIEDYILHAFSDE